MTNSSKSPEHLIRVLIVDDTFETQEHLKRALKFEEDVFEVVGIANSGQEGIRLAKSLSPDIVLMDINMPDMNGLEATALIAKGSPNSQIIIMSIQDESSYIQQAMVAGARSFLSKPISIDELYAAIHSVYDRRRVKTYTQEVSSVGNADTPQAHLIVVYSPQAGAGSTTIATNLAASLMHDEARVLLVDCNLYFGDVGIFLNIQAHKTIADLTAIAEDVAAETVNSMLSTHESGLKILLAPRTPQDAGAIEAKQVITLIKQMQADFDFIIIDTSTQLDELNLALFDIAEQILLIGIPTLAAVKNVRNILDLLDTLQIDPHKVQLIFNRVSADFEKAKVAPSIPSIERNLKRKAIAVIPMDERHFVSAINRGTAVVAKDRNQSPAKELIALAELVRETLVSASQKLTPPVMGNRT